MNKQESNERASNAVSNRPGYCDYGQTGDKRFLVFCGKYI